MRWLKADDPEKASNIGEFGLDLGRIGFQDGAYLIDKPVAMVLVASADNDPNDFDFAVRVCARNISMNADLPSSLREFASAVLRSESSRPAGCGKRTKSTSYRDYLIVLGIRDAYRFGIPPHRRNLQHGKSQCGCSLVVEAFQRSGRGLTYSAAKAAWSALEKHLKMDDMRLDAASRTTSKPS